MAGARGSIEEDRVKVQLWCQVFESFPVSKSFLETCDQIILGNIN
jgi:hypothetical protein